MLKDEKKGELKRIPIGACRDGGVPLGGASRLVDVELQRAEAGWGRSGGLTGDTAGPIAINRRADIALPVKVVDKDGAVGAVVVASVQNGPG